MVLKKTKQNKSVSKYEGKQHTLKVVVLGKRAGDFGYFVTKCGYKCCNQKILGIEVEFLEKNIFLWLASEDYPSTNMKDLFKSCNLAIQVGDSQLLEYLPLGTRVLNTFLNWVPHPSDTSSVNNIHSELLGVPSSSESQSVNAIILRTKLIKEIKNALIN